MSQDGVKKAILITGCTKRSIGDSLARESLSRGLHVIATARTLDKIRHLEPLGAQILELDTTSSDSIASLQAQITHLDILFNNAGINLISPLADTSMEDFKHQFEVNVFGPVELTKTLLPLLIESKGIIVNHTSQSPYGIPSLSGAYAASKAALANYTDVLRIELKPFGVRVVELVTGGAASNITLDMRAPSIPKNSLYAPIRPEANKSCDPETIRGVVMDGDVYARKVMSDILNPRGPPNWTWRGKFATTMWCIWIIKCMWKGIFDGLIARTFGLHLLKGRMKEMELKKE